LRGKQRNGPKRNISGEGLPKHKDRENTLNRNALWGQVTATWQKNKGRASETVGASQKKKAGAGVLGKWPANQGEMRISGEETRDVKRRGSDEQGYR